MASASITLTIDGREYVAVPRADYLRMTGKQSNEALDFGLRELGKDLRRAREHAGLSQGELATKIKKAQSTVSAAEAGKIQVSEAYVKRVLKACGLPESWPAEEAPSESKTKAARKR